MFILFAVVLLIGWIVGLTVMKISAVGIHLLVFFAAVSLFTHFFRRASKQGDKPGVATVK
jgi:hypothetical protein